MSTTIKYDDFIKDTEIFINDMIKRKYLINDEQNYDDIINNRFSLTLNNTNLNKNKLSYIIDMFNEKRCIPAGSVLYGLGNTTCKTSLSNCYYIPILSDSIEGIFDCEKQMAKTFSRRGGCGTSITVLRPKDSPVNNASKTSTGAVSFMPRLSLLAHDIGQLGRRGAAIIDIDCRHPDLLDFIWCKAKPEQVFEQDFLTGYQPDISHANISIQITDKFIEAVQKDLDWELIFPDLKFERYNEEWDGDYDKWISNGYPVIVYSTIKARDILKQIAEASWLCGDPGIIFKDTMQRFSSCSFDESLVPVGVNPCLPSWAPVLTPNGYMRFDRIKNEIILNNQIHTCSDVFETKDSADVYELELESGLKFWSTNDHEIMAYTNNKSELTKLKDLNIEQYVKCDYSCIDYVKNQDEFLLGHKYCTNVIIGEDKLFSLLDHSINVQLGFIQCIINIIGIISTTDNEVNCIDIEFNSAILSEIQYVLCSLNIFSQLNNNKLKIKDIKSLLNVLYLSKFDEMYKLTNVKYDESNEIKIYNLKKKQKIKSITKLDGKYPVYDITVPGPHKFVSSGIVISNCGEQALQKYGNCLLSAIVLYKYVNDPYTPNAEFDVNKFLVDVEHMVYFMDSLIDINEHPLTEQNETDKYSRRIGIEMTGLHDMWAMLNMDYGSEEACEFIDDIMYTKAVCEIKTSINLAKKYSHAPCFKTKKSRTKFINQPYIQRILNKLLKTNQQEITNNIMEHGLRNSAFNTIGPAGSISVVADNCTSGIEPIFNISYYRKSRLFGDKQIKMVHLPLVKAIGPKILSMDDEEIKKKYHYTCAHDIDYITRIKVQSTIQKWIDNSISSTINLNNDVKIDDIYNIYLEAFNKKLKGITVFRDGSKQGILSSKKEIKSNSEKEVKLTSKTIQDHLKLVKDKLNQTHRAYRYVRMWKGNKVYITITIDVFDNPIEIFANVPYEAGIDKRGIYNQEQLMEKKTYWDTICRLISLMLRLNMPLPVILKQLDKSSPTMVELPSIIGQILKKYINYSPTKIKEIKETKIGGELCMACGENTIIYQGGCSVCQNCGDSKCG